MDNPTRWRRFVWFYNKNRPRILTALLMLATTEALFVCICPVLLPVFIGTLYVIVMTYMLAVFT